MYVTMCVCVCFRERERECMCVGVSIRALARVVRHLCLYIVTTRVSVCTHMKHDTDIPPDYLIALCTPYNANVSTTVLQQF